MVLEIRMNNSTESIEKQEENDSKATSAVKKYFFEGGHETR